MAQPWVFRPNPKRPEAKPTAFQSWLITRPHRNVVAVAARRSGKTVGSRARIIRRCVSTPNGLVGYCGPTLKQAKRLIWRSLLRDLRDPAAAPFVGRINRSELSVEFRNGCVFYVYGAERPEQIRGDGFDEFIVDEADDPNFDDEFFNDIVGPALSDQLGTLVQVGSPKGRGRLYREFRKGQASSPPEERDPEYTSIQVTAVQAGIIAPSEIERARRVRPPRSFRQEYEASFEAPVGIIYDEWDERVHVVSEVPARFEDIIVGVDWGTANRGAMLVISVDRVLLPETEDYEACELSRATVLHEETHAGVGYDDDGWWRIARDIQARWHPSRWYADPAGGQEGYLRQLRNALAGSEPRPEVLEADNQVRPGIAAVQTFLHHDPIVGDPPRLLVHESCKWLRKEIADYRWRAHATLEDEFTDEPVKSNDHCFVAGTMVATIDGEVAIEQVVPGTLVLTRNGYRPVVAAGQTMDSAKIWRVEFSNGDALEGTNDHQIWTENRGWVRLDALRYDDILVTCDRKCTRRQSESSSMGCHTGGTHNQTGLSSAIISSQVEANDCIEPCGSTTTDPSQMGTRCTTSTETRSTTPSRISHACQPASTGRTTARKNSGREQESGSKRSGLSQPNGTEANRVEPGTASTDGEHGKAGSLPSTHVSIALSRSKASSQRKERDSARTHASPLGEGSLDLTTLRSDAHAASSSSPISTTSAHVARVRVLRLGPAGRRASVYDLTVAEDHEFFANGVLVHNCMDALRYGVFSYFYRPHGRSKRAGHMESRGR